ncbi:TetR family transcriptional regulator [Nonomuraea sp. NBC_01738]|uniref:TetR/AcrR family transcriptional regulator n=1 Tax=Nonomuraea sp. NBC_01738 TaxID=2976003 RepID=UPI002E0EE16C|nr:TetR family transcriptional regulator [Nonomuraea sp. NBC_01738]
MPPTNPARRQALTDAAIDLLATAGAHGLTHRALEKATGLPAGTASNYFPSREALLVAAAERIAELHVADMAKAVELTPPDGFDLADLLAESLFTAVTVLRGRYLAIFELQLESTRRPALATALSALQHASLQFTAGLHGDLGLGTSRETVAALMTLYGGALFSLVNAPPEHVTRKYVQKVAHVMVHGASSG